MPRFVAVAPSPDPTRNDPTRYDPTRNDPSLEALRRTLWQLAIAGCAIAAALALRVPGTGTIAAWCALLPLAALATWYRDSLRALLHARSTQAPVATPRTPRVQARRARPHGDRRALRVRPSRGPAAPHALTR